MKWSLIKSWAKDKGYKVDRKKSGDEINPYKYEWHRIDNIQIKGTINSLSRLAVSIYNDMTDNRFLEHQKQYQLKQSKEDIDHDRFS